MATTKPVPLPSPMMGDVYTTTGGSWMVTGIPNAASLDHADVPAGPMREWAWQTFAACQSADAVLTITRGGKQIWP